MAVASGMVRWVKVGDDYGMVEIEEATGESETLIIWYLDYGPGGPVGFWTLQLMTALSQGLPVDVSHPDDSAWIQQVRVRAPNTPPIGPRFPPTRVPVEPPIA